MIIEMKNGPYEQLSDALVERVKDFSRMNEGVEAVVLAHENAAIEAVMNTIAGFEHGAPAGKG